MNYQMHAFFFALAMGLSVPAFADDQPPANSSTSETEQALALHKAGNAYYTDKDYARACAAYTAAYALRHHYQIAGSLGDCELQLGRYRDAAEHIDTFIREYPQSASPERLEQAKELLAQARAHVAAIHINVPMPGAEVSVDGQRIGKAPLDRDIYLDAGTHRIEAMMGSDFANQTIDVRAGEQRTVVLQAQPKVPEKPRATGTNRNMGIWAGVVGGVAVAAIGGGIASLWVAHSKDRERDQILKDLSKESGNAQNGVCGTGTPYAGECRHVTTLARENQILQYVGIGGLTLGVAGLATSIGLGLSSGKSTSGPKVGATVFVTPWSSGISVDGHF